MVPDLKQINYKGFGWDEGENGMVVGIGSVRDVFLLHSIAAFHNFCPSDRSILKLYLEYLTQTNGPLFKQVCQQRLASGCYVTLNSNEGFIQFELIRASDVVAAFKEARKTIVAHLKDDAFDDNLLVSAKSGLLTKIIKNESSVADLISEVMLLSYKKVPSDQNKILIQQVHQITKEQLGTVGRKYLSRLFSPEAKTIVVCHPEKVEEITDGFLAIDIDLVPGSEESVETFKTRHNSC